MPGRIVAVIFGALGSLALLGFLAVRGGGVGIVLTAEVLIVVYGLAAFAFLHYRTARQDELRDVLAMAIDAKSPLADAVWAYAEDRPRGVFRRFCEGTVANVLAIGSYWSWHTRFRFDRKVADLASNLESGMALSQALRSSSGIASRETMLAVAVGESTGDLGTPLKHVSQTRIGPAIIEVLPRLIYPLLVLITQIALIAFLTIFITPKFEKIAADFKLRLPYSLELMLSWSKWIFRYAGPFLILGVLALGWLLPALIVSPSFRWRLPGIASVERRFTRGRILKMLGMLLAAGKTAPQALDLLRQQDYLGRLVQSKLTAAQKTVEAGGPLAESLAKQGLLPRNMIALVHSAERARNLPWALEESGDTLVRRARLILQRFSAVVGPLLIVVLGVIAAGVALGIFTTLIAFITKLTPP